MSELDAVVEAIQSGDRFLVAGHIDPDPDCFGSMLAFDWLLERLGKTSLPLSHDPPLPQWRFMPRIDRVRLASSPDAWQEESWDTLVVLDCEVGRTGTVAPWAERVRRVINIDHHVTNDGTGHVNLIRPQACAVGEIVYDIVARVGAPMDSAVATLLFATIMADTGSFRFSNTTPRAFEIASRLVDLGARPDRIAREVYETRSWQYVRLLGRTLETLSRSPGGQVAWITLTQRMLAEEGARKDEAEGLIQYPRMIDGVEVAMIFRELENGDVRVGFRSKERVDVSALALEFGGGGHERAAGCVIAGPIDDAKARVVARAIELAGESK